MNVDTDSFACRPLPQFLTEIELLLDRPNILSDSQLKELLRSSDALAEKNIHRQRKMQLSRLI